MSAAFGIAKERPILLVEDNPKDAKLTIVGFRQNNLMNEIVHVKNGAEALEYLFGTGEYEGRDTTLQPQLVLLDLKLPKVDGLEVLRQIRSDYRTKLLPVVILTSSKEERDLIEGFSLGVFPWAPTPMCASPLILMNLARP
jgi:two-component system, response regulator